MAISLEHKQKFAERLQTNPTKSEQLLKNALLKRGYKFRFNELLYGYIPDFYFPSQQKIVELDGRFHDLEKDKHRDDVFAKHGIQTFRIRSSRVFRELGAVLRSIEVFLGLPVKRKPIKQVKKQSRKRKKRNKKNQVPPVLKGFITKR